MNPTYSRPPAVGLTGAKDILRKAFPELRPMVEMVTFKRSTEIPMMSVTSDWVIKVNPGILETLRPEEIAGLIWHELMHLVRRHHARRRPGEDPYLFNLAADCEINDDDPILERRGVWLPAGAIRPELFGLPRGRTLEQYLDALSRMDLRPGAWPSGDLDPSPAAPCSATLARYRSEAISKVRYAALDDPDRYPKFLQRWSEEDKPTPGLTVKLRRFLTAHPHSLRLPILMHLGERRRSMRFYDMAMPEIAFPTPSLAVIVDVSSSMEEADIRKVRRVLRSVMKEEGVEDAPVIFADSEVRGTTTLGKMKLPPLTGSGTDLRCAFDAVERLPELPLQVIVITDGDTPWPTRSSDYRTLIVLTKSNNVPAWAEKITVKGEKVR